MFGFLINNVKNINNMTETLLEYRKRVARAGGKAKWAGKSKEERSDMMKAVRKGKRATE